VTQGPQNLLGQVSVNAHPNPLGLTQNRFITPNTQQPLNVNSVLG